MCALWMSRCIPNRGPQHFSTKCSQASSDSLGFGTCFNYSLDNTTLHSGLQNVTLGDFSDHSPDNTTLSSLHVISSEVLVVLRCCNSVATFGASPHTRGAIPTHCLHAKTNVRSAGIRKSYGTTPSPYDGSGLEAHGTCLLLRSAGADVKSTLCFVLQQLGNLSSRM